MPWLNWGAASRNPLYCTFYMVWFFCPLGREEWDAKFVQFLGGKKACLLLFFFFFERPLLQNYIMHSSICTNGYFLSCYVDIHARNAAGETCFCLKAIRLTGAGLTHSLSAVTNVLFTLLIQNYASITAGWTRWQANLQDIHFVHLWFKQKKKSSIPGLSPNEWGETG